MVDVLDGPQEPIGRHFRRVNAFVAGARAAGGTVLVHCHGGVSRAAALVLAFLIAHEGMCFDGALASLRAARPIVAPNPGFVTQLREFEAAVRCAGGACEEPSQHSRGGGAGLDPDTPDGEEGASPLLLSARSRPPTAGDAGGAATSLPVVSPLRCVSL